MQHRLRDPPVHLIFIACVVIEVERLCAGQKLRGFHRTLAASSCKTRTWHVFEGIRPHSVGISTHSLASYAMVGAILVTPMFYNHLA